jgi:hypothetical protein
MRHPTLNRRIRQAALECLEGRALLAAIASGQTIADSVVVGQTKSYTFSASVNDTVYVAIGETVPGVGSDPRVELLAPNGASLAAKWDYAGTAITARATVAGTYTIVASDQGADEAMTYNVTLAKGPATQTTTVDDGPIASGQTRTGTFGMGDLDVYTFAANANDYVYIDIGETTAGAGTDPSLALIAPDGSVYKTGWDYNGYAIAGRLTLGGTYTIVAADVSCDETGGYAITLAKGPATQTTSPDDGPIASAQTRTGTVGMGDLDVYTFTAAIGDDIRVAVGETVAGAGFDPALTLIAPDGSLANSIWDYAGTSVQHRATVAGTYTLVVSDQGADESGAYNVTLAKTPGPQTVTADDAPIALNDTKTGTVGSGDLDVYTFSATAGDSIRASIGETTAGSGFDPSLTLVGPDGAVLKSTWDYVGVSIAATATLSGNYYLIAADQGADETGGYTISLAGNIRPFNAPEVAVFGNSVEIADADATPATTDFTDFGTTAAGTTKDRTFTVKNTGTGALTTSGLKVPAGFTITEGLSASIAAGASDTFTVRLAATVAGTFAGDVSFANNDSNETPYNFRISGIVTPAAPPYAVLSGGVLTVTGTSGNDFIRASITANVLTVKMNTLAALTFANASAITRVVVNGNAGNDLIAMAASMNRPTSLNGGDGNDTIYGGSGTDVINGGAGTDAAFKSGSDTTTLVEEVLA